MCDCGLHVPVGSNHLMNFTFLSFINNLIVILSHIRDQEQPLEQDMLYTDIFQYIPLHFGVCSLWLTGDQNCRLCCPLSPLMPKFRFSVSRQLILQETQHGVQLQKSICQISAVRIYIWTWNYMTNPSICVCILQNYRMLTWLQLKSLECLEGLNEFH